MKRWTERSCSHLMASVMAEEERGERIYSLLYFYSFTDHTRTYSVGMTDIVSDLFSAMFRALCYIQPSANGVIVLTDSNNVNAKTD